MEGARGGRKVRKQIFSFSHPPLEIYSPTGGRNSFPRHPLRKNPVDFLKPPPLEIYSPTGGREGI